MATEATNAIPTYGELTGYTDNNFIYNFNNDKIVITSGWTSHVKYTFTSRKTLAIFTSSASTSLNNINFYLCDVTNSTDCPYMPSFVLITGGTSSAPLIKSGSTLNINVCGSATATTRTTTQIYGPVYRSLFLWFDRSTTKYIPL